ncbi:MAG TPA: hypothetical protein VGL83_08955 [Stellaceae bacterium]|jgi:hypothetical protein
MKTFQYAALVGAIAFALVFLGITAWRSWHGPEVPAAANDPNYAIAQYNLWLTIFTGALALLGLIQIAFLISTDITATKSATAAVVSADAAKTASEVAKRALVASQRAWVRIDKIELGGGGLSMDANGASVSISFRFTNVGNSPAIKIRPYAWMVAVAPGVAPSVVQDQKCTDLRHQPFGGMTFTLFPNESFPSSMGIGGWSLGINIPLAQLQTAVLPPNNLLLLTAVGCIDYTFPTDPDAHHQTGFIVEIRQNNGLPIAFQDGLIPIAQLSVTDFPLGAGRYAD